MCITRKRETVNIFASRRRLLSSMMHCFVAAIGYCIGFNGAYSFGTRGDLGMNRHFSTIAYGCNVLCMLALAACITIVVIRVFINRNIISNLSVYRFIEVLCTALIFLAAGYVSVFIPLLFGR